MVTSKRATVMAIKVKKNERKRKNLHVMSIVLL